MKKQDEPISFSNKQVSDADHIRPHEPCPKCGKICPVEDFGGDFKMHTLKCCGERYFLGINGKDLSAGHILPIEGF